MGVHLKSLVAATLCAAVIFGPGEASAQEGGIDWSVLASDLVGWSMGGVQLEALTADWPIPGELRGVATARVFVGRAPSGFYREVRLRSQEAFLGEVPLGVFDLLVRVPLSGGRSTVTFSVDGPLAKRFEGRFLLPADVDPFGGKMAWRSGPIEGQWSVEGLDLGKLTAGYPVLALGGMVDVTVGLSGSLDKPIVEARFDGQELFWRGDAVGRVAVDWRHEDRASELAVEWGSKEAPHLSADLLLPLALDLKKRDVSWLDQRKHKIDVKATGLTPKLIRAFWRAHPATDFTVDVNVEGAGTLDKFDLGATVSGTLKDRDQPPLPILAQLWVGPERQTLSFELRRDILTVDIETKAPLVRLRRTGYTWARVPVIGQLMAAMPLPTLGPYLPPALFNPTGVLEADVGLTGTLGEPDFEGEVVSEGAGVTLVALNQRLRSMAFKGIIEGQTMLIDTFGAKGGLGTISGDGKVEVVVTPKGYDPANGLWEGWTLDGALGLDLTRFPFIHDTFPNGLIDGRVDLGVQARKLDTAIQIKIGDTQARLMDVTMPQASAIPHHRAVRLIDWRGQVKPSQSVFEGEGHLNVDVEILEPIKVKGAGAKLSIEGRMIIDRQDDEARVEGGFRALSGGTFELFENVFTVRSGTLTMLGGQLSDRSALDPSAKGPAQAALHDPNKPAAPVPLEPVVDFTARGQVVDTHVLVKVRGPGRQPELILASSPALPEYRVMTLLVTGRVDAVDDSNGNVRKQVAKLVSRFHNPSLARQLYDRLGVDKLGLGFGKNVTQPILTVGKQIDRQLYVESVYHHNAPPEENEKEGHAEYRLDPRWTLDTVYGDAGFGSVGIFWATSFGGPTPPEPPEDWGDE